MTMRIARMRALWAAVLLLGVTGVSGCGEETVPTPPSDAQAVGTDVAKQVDADKVKPGEVPVKSIKGRRGGQMAP
jgi:hypothetical protein